jgi:hypothetical protein
MVGFRAFSDEKTLFYEARELGGELFRSIEAKRHFPEQDAYLNDFKARMQRLVEYRKKEWIYEYEFWQTRK